MQVSDIEPSNKYGINVAIRPQSSTARQSKFTFLNRIVMTTVLSCPIHHAALNLPHKAFEPCVEFPDMHNPRVLVTESNA